MTSEDDSSADLVGRIRKEWPAALAILVLVIGHLYLVGVQGQELTPFGIPLVLAVIVFLVGEAARRFL